MQKWRKVTIISRRKENKLQVTLSLTTENTTWVMSGTTTYDSVQLSKPWICICNCSKCIFRAAYSCMQNVVREIQIKWLVCLSWSGSKIIWSYFTMVAMAQLSSSGVGIKAPGNARDFSKNWARSILVKYTKSKGKKTSCSSTTHIVWYIY